jgi:hypothetical protein
MQHFIIALLICAAGLPQPPLAHWGSDYGHGHSQVVGCPDQPFELLAAVAPQRGAPGAQEFEALLGSSGIINIGFCPIYGLVARHKWMVSAMPRAAVCARGARCCCCCWPCARRALLCVRARRALLLLLAVRAARAAVCARITTSLCPPRCAPYRDSTQAPSPARTTPPSSSMPR